MNKYQEALDNLYRRSTDTHFYIPMGEDKLWKNTLQELINEHEKLKEENQKLKDKETPKKVCHTFAPHPTIESDQEFDYFYCPNCGEWVNEKCMDNYCSICGQKLDWSEVE